MGRPKGSPNKKKPVVDVTTTDDGELNEADVEKLRQDFEQQMEQPTKDELGETGATDDVEKIPEYIDPDAPDDTEDNDEVLPGINNTDYPEVDDELLPNVAPYPDGNRMALSPEKVAGVIVDVVEKLSQASFPVMYAALNLDEQSRRQIKRTKRYISQNPDAVEYPNWVDDDVINYLEYEGSIPFSEKETEMLQSALREKLAEIDFSGLTPNQYGMAALSMVFLPRLLPALGPQLSRTIINLVSKLVSKFTKNDNT